MTELKKTVAKNIATLRVASHLTQFELGEKLNYSDKAVSRWERGEAIPDAYVLLQMAEIFGVTVDFILKPHTEDDFTEQKEEEALPQGVPDKVRRLVILLSFLGVWSLALVAFVISAFMYEYFWLAFIYALPISFLVLFIFNCLWGTRKLGVLYLSATVWGLLLSLHLSLLAYPNAWLFYLVGIPAQIIIPIAFLPWRNKTK